MKVLHKREISRLRAELRECNDTRKSLQQQVDAYRDGEKKLSVSIPSSCLHFTANKIDCIRL